MMQNQNIFLPTIEQLCVFEAITCFDMRSLMHLERNKAQLAYAQIISSLMFDETWRFRVAPSIAWDQLSVQPICVPIKYLGNGAIICDMRDFVESHQEVFSILGAFHNEHIISKLTYAAWNRGVVVYVPRGVRVITPIDLQMVEQYAGTLCIEYVIIILEEGAHAIVHDMASKKNNYHVIRSIEVTIHDHAQLTFISGQDRAKETTELSAFTFHLGNHSVLNYSSLVTGSQFSKSWLDVIMHGEHAQADIRGVSLLDGNRTVDVTTMQRHNGAHNVSNLRIKSAVRDHARSVFHGNVHIAANAQGTRAAQENKNILLSEQASAYSIPNLEALHNDVHCAHGSAVGQLDAEQLLYLQARGIAYKQAQRMLLQGFLADAIPDYVSKSVHEGYTTRIATWLDI